jgi:drug/metabolite transporter (DMT)-like permease
MAKILTILLVGLLCEAIGVVLLSRGLKEINRPAPRSAPGDLHPLDPTRPLEGVSQTPPHTRLAETVALIKRGVTNVHILLGVFFEAVFFVALLMLISKADVSFVWPLTSLSFVVTTIAAKMYLHEYVSPLRWAGVCLIMMGAGLITWTEKQQSTTPTASPVAQSPSGGPVSLE